MHGSQPIKRDVDIDLRSLRSLGRQQSRVPNTPAPQSIDSWRLKTVTCRRRPHVSRSHRINLHHRPASPPAPSRLRPTSLPPAERDSPTPNDCGRSFLPSCPGQGQPGASAGCHMSVRARHCLSYLSQTSLARLWLDDCLVACGRCDEERALPRPRKSHSKAQAIALQS